MLDQLYLLRHGETEWSKSGRHTGVSEIPLTEKGGAEAVAAGERLKGVSFDHVFTSPRVRARHTLELAGLGARAQVMDDLHEWVYGDYEGLLPTEIQARHPGWNVFEHGCPNGETPAQAAERADRVVAKIRAMGGTVLAVSHGHFTRAIAMRWVGLDIKFGGLLDSATASVSILGTKADGRPVIKLWNSR